jgi:hypothetical protein
MYKELIQSMYVGLPASKIINYIKEKDPSLSPNFIRYADFIDAKGAMIKNNKEPEIEDFVSYNSPLLILYSTSDNYGHFACITMNKKNELSFFDSYGYAPDSQFDFIPQDYFIQHYNERATDAGMLGFAQKSPLQFLIYNINIYYKSHIPNIQLNQNGKTTN